jgi:ring-1,2-phenylacetyl-CoA epoxidase subunit PaaC
VFHRGEQMTKSTLRVPQTQLLMLADTCLLWGHRLSEWCGHGPALEEDIALTNTALDAIGQARQLYQLYALRDGNGNEDTLAYFREPDSFNNLSIAAVANGDYACTILRSFYLSAWLVPVWEQLAKQGGDAEVAAVALDAAKASRMTLRHAREWVIRFGDGTGESRRRIEAAMHALSGFTAELFAAAFEHIDQTARNAAWLATVNDTFREATLPPFQASAVTQSSGHERTQLLTEMQSLAREHPDAVW